GSTPAARAAWTRLICETPHPHVEDETEACQRGDEGGPAVAHERQRDPFHRREAGRHRHVVNHLERESRNDASHQIRAEAILGEPGRLERSKDDEEIQAERGEHADEPLFLRQNREDEVVVRDGQELVLPLRPVAEPLAGEAARSDRDARLDRLVARAARILLGIEKRLDTLALIVLERELVAEEAERKT